jgi:hypothetical protein
MSWLCSSLAPQPLDVSGVFVSAETGTALNPFRSLPYIRMCGKVSRSFFPFFLFYIDQVVATICQFVEIQLHRGGWGTRQGRAPVARCQNQDERIYRRASHRHAS